MTAPATEPLRILNTDDYAPARYARTKLLRQAGFDVVEAETGAEALRQAVATRPHVILLDVKLPDLDGYEVCRMFRQTPELARIPFVFLTARLQEEGRLAELGGHVAMIAKPFDPTELVATVRRLIEGASA